MPHLRNLHESGSSYRCFSCPTYFGELKAMTDDQGQYHNDISSSDANVDFSDLLDLITEAVNSKFRIHWLKLDHSGVWSRSSTLFASGKKISFVNALLRETSSLKLGTNLAVRLGKPMESETVEVFFNLPFCRVACELTEDENMQQIDALMTQLNLFANDGSSWVVETFKQLEIKTYASGNVTGGFNIVTPPVLKSLKCSIFNVVNKKGYFCFLGYIEGAIFSSVGRPHSPEIHKKISNNYLSTRS